MATVVSESHLPAVDKHCHEEVGLEPQGDARRCRRRVAARQAAAMAWSFVRDDQPRTDTARQVALALHDEAARDLAAARIRIHVDEPALRELLPKLAAAGFVRGIGPGAYTPSTALGRRPPMRSLRSSGSRVGASGQAVGQPGLRAEDTLLRRRRARARAPRGCCVRSPSRTRLGLRRQRDLQAHRAANIQPGGGRPAEVA
jgi:hypothetical protein